MASADRHDGPVAQLNLLRSIILTDWSTSLDHKVSAIIIDRYYPKFGGARASLRFLEEGTGSTRPNIIASIRRLVAHGAFTVKVEGKGTRPTEYALNFGFVSRGIAGDTSASGIADDTSCGIAGDTSMGSSGIAHDTETYLHVPAYNAGIHEGRNEFEAAPTAPPAAGLAATAAETASGGFEDFWKAWPRKHGKKKAKAEWTKITHDVDTIIDAAREWADHYEKHGTEKKWIPEPANWLAGERWDEDLPLIHIDAKGAAIAKAKANAPAKKPEPAAANDDEPVEVDIPEFMKGSPSLWPIGEYEGEFIEGNVDDSTGDHEVTLSFLVTSGEHNGDVFQHRFLSQAYIKSYQEEGQKIISDIVNALGLSGVTDTDELLFRPLRIRADGRDLHYSKYEQKAA
ncbi:hypothetical protein KXS15_09590 [Sinorhizobium meliloti]|uniref:hypothetical protein n=1 Tax=Rhizobium meliloti TaxID=382 RepID=UPI003F185773